VEAVKFTVKTVEETGDGEPDTVELVTGQVEAVRPYLKAGLALQAKLVEPGPGLPWMLILFPPQAATVAEIDPKSL
jgi:hypothetical protein